jgi:uncharacterized protein (TIGR02391 family)
MMGYRHILLKGEISSGRINISEKSKEECMRSLGEVQGRPFNIFRSDGTFLVRNTRFQRVEGKSGLRLNLGQNTFSGCSEGTEIWLRLNKNKDVEVEIGSSINSIVDNELSYECLPILENPEKDNYWQAVNSAFTILETRIRNQTGAGPNYFGDRLIDFAFKPDQGILVCRENKNGQEGIYYLFRGIMKAFRNPNVHQKQELTRIRARQTVAAVDLLLAEINTAQKRTP